MEVGHLFLFNIIHIDIYEENQNGEKRVPYDDVRALFPLEDLPEAAVTRGAAAAAVLREAGAPRLEVAACSTATGYRLATMSLTVVEVAALSNARRTRLASAVGDDLEGVRTSCSAATASGTTRSGSTPDAGRTPIVAAAGPLS